MITEHKITQGFFAGCTVYEDDELPPNTIEMKMLNGTVYRYNVVTDEITESKLKEYNNETK